MSILMIDNYDSFTYNLVQYFQELGVEVVVHKNDAITIAQIEEFADDGKIGGIVISPGPCTPNESGISLQVIQHFHQRLPILGVCLGHQAIAQYFGAKVIRAEKVMHGKTSLVRHRNTDVFSGLANPLQVTRYHSLVVAPESLPDCLDVTAVVDEDKQAPDLIMGLAHKSYKVFGVQFHPESILSQSGHELLNNFVEICANTSGQR